MKLTEVIHELRKLNQPVPIPPRLPTAGEVDDAESQLGMKFHKDYRQFLLEAGDVVYGTKEPARVTPKAGHLNLIEMVEGAWELDGVRQDLLPFCFDNGNYFCMNGEGEVEYWDHNGTTDEKWRDLATWIKEVWIEGG